MKKYEGLDTSNAIRVLHVLGNMNIGGAEARIMDIYRKIDREKIQFDFLLHTSEKCDYNDEIAALGGRIYCVPHISIRTFISYIKSVNSFFDEHTEYRIIHEHATNGGFILHLIAKKHGIPVRIAHARSAGFGRGILGLFKKILCYPLRFCVTHKFAVSGLAGQSRFGKHNVNKGNVQVIPNGINLEHFKYNEVTRNEIREKLGLVNNFVIGHVGAFNYAKNHEYLIDIFYEVCRKINTSILILIGIGDMESSIKQKVETLGLSESVKFLGSRTDVPELLQAMDIFVFPSRYEGLPGAVVEAQATGLRCLVSDKVSSEIKITDLVEFLSIKKPAKVWADRIVEYSRSGNERVSKNDELYKAGYDARVQAKRMEDLYLSFCD